MGYDAEHGRGNCIEPLQIKKGRIQRVRQLTEGGAWNMRSFIVLALTFLALLEVESFQSLMAQQKSADVNHA